MAVRLRLRRIGKRNRPFYRICAMDTRKARGGEYIEAIGHYDPMVADDEKKVQIDTARAEYWLSVGAQPSETVFSFLRARKVPGLVRPKAKTKPRKRRPSKEDVARRAKRVAKRKKGKDSKASAN